jgi:aspartate aminotransferase-like enzyme
MFDEHMDLHLPGPTIVPPQVRRAILQGAEDLAMNYRSQRFGELHLRVTDKLRRVMRTRNDVLILSGSGAAAIEAGVGAIVAPGDTVITCVSGFFGEYASSIAKRIGAQEVRVDASWGESIDPDAVAAALARHPEARAVVVTHCETSTGVVNDVRAIAELVAPTDTVLAIDAVSSLVSTPLETDAWGIDVVMSASQKALMLPPGLALVSVSDKAWELIEARPSRSFYFDLPTYRAAAASGATPFTPNVPLIVGLAVALDLILTDGVDASWARHALLRDMTRAGIRAMSLELLAGDAIASSTLTTVRLPRADAVRTRMADELHFIVGGGLGRLSDQLLRLGHLGWTPPLEVLKMLAALELALHHDGRPGPEGAGVVAAQRAWTESRLATAA